MTKIFFRYWWIFIIRGLFLLFFGSTGLLSLLEWGGVVEFLFASFLICEGILFSIPIISKEKYEKNAMFIIIGITSSVLGISYFLFPTLISFIWKDLTTGMRVYFFKIWIVLIGISGVVGSIHVKEDIFGKWILIISSGIPFLLAIILFSRPNLEMHVLVWIVGLFFIIYGATMILFGFHCRKADRVNPKTCL